LYVVLIHRLFGTGLVFISVSHQSYFLFTRLYAKLEQLNTLCS